MKEELNCEESLVMKPTGAIVTTVNKPIYFDSQLEGQQVEFGFWQYDQMQNYCLNHLSKVSVSV